MDLNPATAEAGMDYGLMECEAAGASLEPLSVVASMVRARALTLC
jgi:hypothetical protein